MGKAFLAHNTQNFSAKFALDQKASPIFDPNSVYSEAGPTNKVVLELKAQI